MGDRPRPGSLPDTAERTGDATSRPGTHAAGRCRGRAPRRPTRPCPGGDVECLGCVTLRVSCRPRTSPPGGDWACRATCAPAHPERPRAGGAQRPRPRRRSCGVRRPGSGARALLAAGRNLQREDGRRVRSGIEDGRCAPGSLDTPDRPAIRADRPSPPRLVLEGPPGARVARERRPRRLPWRRRGLVHRGRPGRSSDGARASGRPGGRPARRRRCALRHRACRGWRRRGTWRCGPRFRGARRSGGWTRPRRGPPAPGSRAA